MAKNDYSWRGIFLLWLPLCIITIACDDIQPLKNTFSKTPRETYLSALEDGVLAGTRMVEAWKMAGQDALEDSLQFDLPVQETGYFRAAEPSAYGYRFDLQAGEIIHINLESKPDNILFFIDLFEVEQQDSIAIFNHIKSAGEYQTDSIRYEASHDGLFLLRLQPELLATCSFTLTIVAGPAYGFPVSGKGNPDIWSFFGDDRDGGRRRHEGVDIFAPRGTPVVAPTDGTVFRVRNRGLGGKQVWLRDRHRNQALYYAHLDSQLVRDGQRVRTGDTLGLVGNTGNASGTQPHLHFGIYRRNRGAIDPQPYISTQSQRLPRLTADTAWLGQWVRTSRPENRLRIAPDRQAPLDRSLEQYVPLRILAANGNWYRVRTPEGKTGYLNASSLEPTDRPLQSEQLPEITQIFDHPNAGAAAVSDIGSGESVDILGNTRDFHLVRLPNGPVGWMPASGK